MYFMCVGWVEEEPEVITLLDWIGLDWIGLD